MLFITFMTLIIASLSTSCSSTPPKKVEDGPSKPAQRDYHDNAIGPGEIALAYRPNSADNKAPGAPDLGDKLPQSTKLDMAQKKLPQDVKTVKSDTPQSQNKSAAALPKEVATPPRPDKQYVVDAALLNVRTGPGMKFSASHVLKKGTKVKMLERKGVWVKIAPEQFVSIRHLTDYKTQ